MRDAADDVSTELDRLSHEFAAAVERHDAELGKCDELQIDLTARFFADLDKRPQRGEIRDRTRRRDSARAARRSPAASATPRARGSSRRRP